MPYVSCPTCGLRTYCIGGEECPVCGTSLGSRPRATSRPREGEGAEPVARGPLERLLATARRQLRMDAAVLSEIRDGREVVVSAVSNGRIPATAGSSVPLGDTICQKVLDGALEGVVHDTSRDDDLRDLPAVREIGTRSYIGVQVPAPVARRYVLCCASRDARPDLGASEVRFLRGLAEDVRPVIGSAIGAG